MRIVSGIHKGKRIVAPKKLPVRPTTDFAKEALFNILNNRVTMNSLRVLDLFAGTGNISFEFASRGALDVISVDAHYGCVQFIRKTAETLNMPINTVKTDVFKYLAVSQAPFDIIFADPPYNFETEQLKKIVEQSLDNNLLNEEGVLIIEHTKHLDLSSFPQFDEARKYGGSVFSFFSQ